MSTPAVDARIRALRGPKSNVDAWKAYGALVEHERRPDGSVERALTIFLAGSECPFTCSFCDLWRWTIDGPTPRGALPRQIAEALGTMNRPPAARLKLYNASNFFDRRAVPADDVPAIAALAEPFTGVTVESHAGTIGKTTLEFAAMIPGRLEVAMGLETIHPGAMAQLNKHMNLAQFDRAAGFLADHGIDMRVFVLLGAPHVPETESVDWTVRTAQYAARLGAAVVSIIPVRAGNGELERLAGLGHFAPPTLVQVEDALDRCIGSAATVFTADLWDVDRVAACSHCRSARVARLRAMNVSGRLEPPVACEACASS